MTTKLALVTGGNGFVGCHVVRALLDRGDRVRVLARENADLSALAGLPVEIVRGDLRNSIRSRGRWTVATRFITSPPITGCG